MLNRITFASFALLCLLCLKAVPDAGATSKIPNDWIVGLYEEGLGRAPEPGGWTFMVNYYKLHGCTAATLRDGAIIVYSSSEYTAKGYDNTYKVETLYEGILHRYPDTGGWEFWLGELDAGHTIANVITRLTALSEFQTKAIAICR